MGIYANCGIRIGETASGITVHTSTAIGATDHVDWEGFRAEIPTVMDSSSLIVPSATAKAKGELSTRLTGRGILCRNKISGGIEFPAGKLVKLVWARVNGQWVPQISALATAADPHCYPLDCLIPGGLAINDLCWVRVGGLARFLSADAGVTALQFLAPTASGTGEVGSSATHALNDVGYALEAATNGQLFHGLVYPRTMGG